MPVDQPQVSQSWDIPRSAGCGAQPEPVGSGSGTSKLRVASTEARSSRVRCAIGLTGAVRSSREELVDLVDERAAVLLACGCRGRDDRDWRNAPRRLVVHWLVLLVLLLVDLAKQR